MSRMPHEGRAATKSGAPKAGVKRGRMEVTAASPEADLLPSIRILLDQHLVRIDERLSSFQAQLMEQAKQYETQIKELTGALQFQETELKELKSKVSHLEQLNAQGEEELQEQINRLDTYILRENLVFLGVNENAQEKDTEKVVKEFLVKDLKMAKEKVDRIEFQRIHRVASRAKPGPRPIKARFLRYGDALEVLQNAPKLKGTNMYVTPDLPKRVRDVRNEQMPVLRVARGAGKLAYFSRSEPTKLFVDRVWLPVNKQKNFLRQVNADTGRVGFRRETAGRNGSGGKAGSEARRVEVATTVEATRRSGLGGTSGEQGTASSVREGGEVEAVPSGSGVGTLWDRERGEACKAGNRDKSDTDKDEDGDESLRVMEVEQEVHH